MAYPHLGSTPTGSDPPASLVRAELGRVLASDLFTRSERLSAFLKFIVEQTLAGHGESLKEQVIAVELYGKGADFNTAADPIVRVDARRLRDRLREYYETAPDRGIVISVPKGSYTPVFARNDARAPVSSGSFSRIADAASDADALAPAVPSANASAATAGRLSGRWWIAAGAIALIAAGFWGTMRLGTRDVSEATRLLTVTSLPGAEEDPSLSPDGNFVVFSWRESTEGNGDLWIQSVDGDARRRLTNTPDADEKFPAWSRDGQFIAFTRIQNGVSSVVIVSALGGSERTIERGRFSAWLPDGRSLIIRSGAQNGRSVLVQYALHDGARRQVTEAPDGFAEQHPRVSPDGKTVAFIRHGDGRSALFVVPIDGGEPRMLGEWRPGIGAGLEWTPDGQEILYAQPEISGRRLVRINIAGQTPAVPVSNIPFGSVNPSVSRPRGSTYRLALSAGQPDVGLRLVDLQPPRQGATITGDTPFCDATRMDVPGRFSPDGDRVAFVSDRSGTQQIWVANRDGSALRTVTQLDDATMTVGSWSPDSRSLTFDATIGQETHIYVVSVDGGLARRPTNGTATEVDPEWSRDGRWIYYSSNQSGSWAIWRTAPDGNGRLQLTSEPGFQSRHSADGRSLYFLDRPRASYGLGPPATLKRIAADGGPVEIVDAAVMPGAWELTDAGIVFIAERSGPADMSSAPDVLQMYDFAARRVRTLGELAFRVSPYGVKTFLTVSRDGRWALASHVDRWERDIFVLDRFR